MNEYTKISELKGVGAKTEQIFTKLDIYTVGDLIRYYPRGYDIYEKAIPISEAEEGKTVTVTGSVYGRVQVGGSRNMQVTTLYLKDLTGTLKVIWYRMPFLRSTLSSGGVITLRGRISMRKNTAVMEHPEIFYPAEKYSEKLDTLQPIYPLTTGLSNNLMVKSVKQALDGAGIFREVLPEELKKTYQLCSWREAVYGIHFPKSKEEFYRARNRLVFEEFLIFILALRRQKESGNRIANSFHITPKKELDTFQKELPFELTKAQKKVWSQIQTDLQSSFVMSRLIQGDVGSGKTIVAVLGLILVGMNGYQGAFMAPTEVLARQHYASVQSLFDAHHIPLQVELLTGSMTAKEKRLAYERIATGESKVIIGTHALIQDKVLYENLALVITDEQHRFGVRQREALATKGQMPHILVMSATPIPRTLAIILYGDLDVSIMDELPANRLPIKNCVVDTGYRATAYRFIRQQVSEGRQCYVICPMVEESEHLEVENVTDYAKTLQQELGDEIQVGVLHGRMKQVEKDQIMEAFADNQIQVLVSTTVIEVGIDVPNSTVMMIENAERFGLAQLHQLRGRVGRGEHQSYCIFMSGSKANETKERLKILEKSNDGFFIAGEDLRLRGPGDVFGIRQSGLMDFKLGDVYQDSELLKKANEAAGEILKEDPVLEKNENLFLQKQVERYLEKGALEMTL